MATKQEMANEIRYLKAIIETKLKPHYRDCTTDMGCAMFDVVVCPICDAFTEATRSSDSNKLTADPVVHKKSCYFSKRQS
jgi:hypothetical protein